MRHPFEIDMTGKLRPRVRAHRVRAIRLATGEPLSWCGVVEESHFVWPVKC